MTANWIIVNEIKNQVLVLGKQSVKLSVLEEHIVILTNPSPLGLKASICNPLTRKTEAGKKLIFFEEMQTVAQEKGSEDIIFFQFLVLWFACVNVRNLGQDKLSSQQILCALRVLKNASEGGC